MRNELLNHLQLDDLKGETHELAETIGMDAFRRLVDVYGGTGRVYIRRQIRCSSRSETG